MRSSPVWTLFAVEMRLLLRDRRTLFASVLLPLLIMPLFFVLSRAGEEQRQQRQAQQTFEYLVTGSMAEPARQLLALAESAAEAAPDGATSEGTASDGATSDGATSGGASDGPASNAAVTLVEKSLEGESTEQTTQLGAEEIVALLEEWQVHVVLEALSVAEAKALDALLPSPEVPGGADEPALELPLLRAHFSADWDASTTAVDELERRIGRALAVSRDQLLDASGSPFQRNELAAITERLDVATAGERTGATLGKWAPLFMMLFLIVGGSVVAADALAGERERGTLETVLTTAAQRREILLAKALSIFAVGLLITLVQLLNIGLYAGLRWIDLPAGFVADLRPSTVFWLMVLFVPYASLVSAVLLWVSGRSATYKSFQVALLPVMLMLLVPAAAAFLPGLDLRSVLAAIPVAGAAVAARELLSGRPDFLWLIATAAVTQIAAWFIAHSALRDLTSERLVSSTGGERAVYLGGAELLERRVLGYFAGAWVVIFLGSIAFGLGLRGQVLFNLVVVFLGGSWLLIRRYGLDVRQTLGLRSVCPSVWAGVVLGAPAMFLVGVAVARLSGELFPLPEAALESLGQGLVPPEMGLVELLFFLAVLPGVCEEVAFRGVLLQALRRRLPPWSLVIVTAAVFALFHIEWVRLLPTFFLGLVLAVLVLRTGSLWPAIVWHMLNNGSAILAERIGLDVASLPPSAYGGAAAVAALAWVLIWRGGTVRGGTARSS